MESDGFTLVKRSRKRQTTNFPKAGHEGGTEANACIDIRTWTVDEISAKVTVQDQELCDKIQLVIKERDIEEIVCYGIGRLSSCKLAFYQFSTLVALMKICHNLKRAYLFDPVLSVPERALVSQYMNVLPRNDLCKRRMECNTLFYMIHSSRRMYDNVLSSNWDQLNRCTILGNSFKSYMLTTSDETLQKQVPHLYHATDHSSEVELPTFTSYPNVFNDTVITSHFSLPENLVARGVMEVDASEDGLEIIEGDPFGVTI